MHPPQFCFDALLHSFPAMVRRWGHFSLISLCQNKRNSSGGGFAWMDPLWEWMPRAQLAIVYVLSLLVQKMSAAGFFGRTSARSADGLFRFIRARFSLHANEEVCLRAGAENVKVVSNRVGKYHKSQGLAIFEKLLFIFLACYVLEVPDIL
jgi:hypothetical protein